MHSGALLDGFREGRGEERHIADLRGLAAVRIVGCARRARGGRGHGEDGQCGTAVCQQVGCKFVFRENLGRLTLHIFSNSDQSLALLRRGRRSTMSQPPHAVQTGQGPIQRHLLLHGIHSGGDVGHIPRRVIDVPSWVFGRRLREVSSRLPCEVRKLRSTCIRHVYIVHGDPTGFYTGKGSVVYVV